MSVGAPQGAPPGPPQYPADRVVGLRVWIAVLIVVVAIVAVWVALDAAVPTQRADAGANADTRTPSQSVDTRTRPPSTAAPKTYADPLPAALRPGWKVTDLDVSGKGDYSGVYDAPTQAAYTAWIAKLHKAGFVDTRREKNDATNYDLHKGHTRLLGNLIADTPPGVTFVYDVNGY